MSEKRATTSSGGLAARQPIEPHLADHLGRLLAHADRLLSEWQAHADGLRARFEREAQASGDVLARTLEGALAEATQQASVQLQRGFGANAEALRVDLERARQAAADLEAHMRRIAGGAKPTSVDELRAGLQGINAKLATLAPRGSTLPIALAALANVLLGVVLFVLLRPTPKPPEPAPEPVPAPVVVVTPDAGPPPRPPPPPCGALVVEGVATSARVAQACVAALCEPPQKLADCRRDGAAGDLVAALRSLERDRALGKLGCPLPDKDVDGRYAVTVRWLLDCPTQR